MCAGEYVGYMCAGEYVGYMCAGEGVVIYACREYVGSMCVTGSMRTGEGVGFH